MEFKFVLVSPWRGTTHWTVHTTLGDQKVVSEIRHGTVEGWVRSCERER